MGKLNEICELLYSAYKNYRELVIGDSVLYERYVSIFLDMNVHVEEENSVSYHPVSMNHVRELLVNRPLVAKYFFGFEGLQVPDMRKVISVINQTPKGRHISESRGRRRSSFKSQSNMIGPQLQEIVRFANSQKIFIETVTPETLESFFSDQKVILTSNNNADVAMFLQALRKAEFIVGFGATEIEHRKNLMRPSGLPIKAQDLITPLNRKQKDPRFKMWCDEILEISKRGKHQED